MGGVSIWLIIVLYMLSLPYFVCAVYSAVYADIKSWTSSLVYTLSALYSANDRGNRQITEVVCLQQDNSPTINTRIVLNIVIVS